MILAIDCSASLCAASVHDEAANVELGRCVLDLGKGHAERLMAVIADALKAGGVNYAGLSAIAVSVGPGSFTGVRVGVSAARGLALALKIPAIGVTTLEALAQQARQAFPGRAVLVALDGGRDEIHAALYDEAAILRYGPAVATMAEMVEMASTNKPVLAGTAAMKIADAATGPFNGGPFDIGTTDATSDIAVYARLAATKSTGEKPHPVYLRAADAKPQAGFVLPRIS